MNEAPFIISGGNTIKSLFKNLNIPLNNKILLSDERLVKRSSNLRNDKFFKKLIKKKLIKKNSFIHYNSSIFNKLELLRLNKKIQNIHFKYAILSLGSNGHFASIFNTQQNKQNYYLIKNSPKFPSKRVTISLEKLKLCEQIYLICSLKNKKKEIQNYHKNKLMKKIGLRKFKLFIY